MPRKVLIVGGGISGLAAAHRFHQLCPEAECRLIERRDRFGGNIKTERVGEFLIDAGPDSFLSTKPEALKLAEELGLKSRLLWVRPNCSKLRVAHRGQALDLPAGMTLGVPTRVRPILSCPLLSVRGRLRALLEPLVPPPDGPQEESIEAFFSRRAGREIAERIAGPLLSGIFAGDPAELSMNACFPMLQALEQRYGSLAFGTYAMQQRASSDNRSHLWEDLPQLVRALHMLPWGLWGSAQSKSPFVTFKQGMAELVTALEQALSSASLETGRHVAQLRRTRAGWSAEIVGPQGNETWQGDAVVLACPASQAAAFVDDAHLARLLSAIEFVSTATVVFGFERASVVHPLDGLGVLVPKAEGKVSAITFTSSKWEGRAPADKVLLRTYLGGTREPTLMAESTDAELAALGLGELRRLLGRLGEPLITKVYRYTRPLPTLGHAARAAAIRQHVRAQPGLYIVGAGIDGVGIPDCVRAGDAAGRLMAQYCC